MSSTHTRQPNKAAPASEEQQSATLTPSQLKFIECLMLGHNISESALMSGVSRRSATYWLSEKGSAVRIEYEKQRIAAQSTVFARVQSLHDLAFKTLEDLMKSKANPVLRFQAAKLIYDSQLAEIARPKALDSSPALIVNDAHYSFEEQRKQDTSQVFLYDDKGRARIVD